MRKLLLSLVAVTVALFSAVAQNKTVQGTVTGADGAPIAGATVVVEGTSIGTTTDMSGHYVISAPSDGELSVSFIGYEDQTVAIAGKTTVDVTLTEGHTKIDDVIVVAYGQTTKEAFTGSAAVVRSDDIVKSQTTNVIEALNGKVAGVQITNVSGNPSGGASTIRVRGISSINAGQSPLIILDGMAFAGDITDINPTDIESMSVLKDAAAAALYGARGANGVILINTKRAKTNDAMVNVDIKVGVNQRAQQDYNFISDPGEYYEAHYAAMRNYYYYDQGESLYDSHVKANAGIVAASGGGLGYNVFTVPAGQTLIGTNGRLNPNATLGRLVSYQGEDYWVTPDNWKDEIYGTGIRQEYNVNIAAANDKANFYGSFGYLNNEGIITNTGFERYSARLRADYQAKKWLKVGANAAYMHSYSNSASGEGADGSSGSIFAYLNKIAPIYPLYVRDGEGKIRKDEYGITIYDHGTPGAKGSNAGLSRAFLPGANPYAAHLLDKHNSTSNTASFNGNAEFSFLKNFKLLINGGVSLNQYESISTSNMFYGAGVSNGGSIGRGAGMYWSYTLQQMLTYNRTFNEKHTVDVLLGHENTYEMGRSLSGSKSGLFSGSSSELPQALVTVSTSSGLSEYSNEGYFLRAQYDYDQRIYVSGSYRRDASSRFHPKHRWGNFWSLSAAWILSNEKWFNASWVDMLKLKASYGSQGNDNIGDFLYVDRYAISNDGTDNWSVAFSQKGNENITWETNGNLNVGVEFSLFRSRLSGSIEYFNRITSDMLSQVSVPSSLGYSYYWKNVGNMTNQGFEIDLTGTIIEKKHVTWDINLNLSYVKNKITKLAESAKTDTYYTLDGDAYNGYRNGTLYYGEGLPIYTRLTRAYAGVDDSGRALFYVRKADGTLDTTTDYSNATEFIVGDTGNASKPCTGLPDLYGGFGTSLNFYGFDLGVNFVYQIGGTLYDSEYAASMSSPMATGANASSYHRDLYKSWSPENNTAKIPHFQMNDQYTAANSNRFFIDGSYLSLQNLTFGYTIPRKLTSKISISKLRVYLSCENVWLWSQRKGFDPRQQYYALAGGTSSVTGSSFYSPVRTISGGINVTF